jgi:hypothetical protein
MPFLPEEYHRVAKALYHDNRPTGEGRNRTIAGRAYYSAYLATREALRRTHGFSEGYRPPHDILSQTLAQMDGEPDIKKLGSLLDTLRHTRVHADYKLSIELSEFDAEDAIDAATDILTLLPTVEARLPRIAG